MTIALTGPLRATALRTEYGGAAGPMRITPYYRGTTLVKANAGGNSAVNLSAAVPTSGPIRVGTFRGQAKGWTYTNATVRTNSFAINSVFGTDWNVDWPKRFINNATMGATSTSYNAAVITGGVGPFTFENNAEIQGAGGVPNSGAGTAALRITSTQSGVNRPIILNNPGGAIRGGGGAGGRGGNGGTGGQGYYTTAYTATDGPYYTVGSYEWTYKITSGIGNGFYWAGVKTNATYGTYSLATGGYTYYANTMQVNDGTYHHYSVHRTYPSSYNTYTAGGAGGTGGNGGRGIGYGSANLAGSGGTAGGAPGTNGGYGGTGGTGGSGQTWGTVGNTGNTGNTGAGGNYTGGLAGAAGSGGGAGGYSIYADASSPWKLTNSGTLNGLTGGGTAPT